MQNGSGTSRGDGKVKEEENIFAHGNAEMGGGVYVFQLLPGDGNNKSKDSSTPPTHAGVLREGTHKYRLPPVVVQTTWMDPFSGT